MGMMRCAKPAAVLCLVVLVGAGCTAMQGSKRAATPAVATPAETQVVTPVPTVPPRTATPVAAAPLPTRPVKSDETEAAKKAGKQVGPVITHLGLARADGTKIEPKSTQKDGTSIYENSIGSGFILVVEAKPGMSNIEIGRRITAYDKDDPSSRPDLEIQTNKDLGDGSKVVCDKRRPNIGGVPGINPPSFADGRQIADALNDLSCRFEVFIESASACTVTKYGDFSFLNNESKVQYCMIVARAWNFPPGDTLVSVRVRDKEGNPGPVKKMILRRADRPVKPAAPAPQPTKSPTPSRRRP
jgi:hypothetical protein